MGPPERADRTLAESLRPHLITACGQRLGTVSWFRTDWQRGGAATGRATWTLDDGTTRNCIVKVPVGPRELYWTRRLQRRDGGPPETIAQLLASGRTLGPYDLGWMVIEALPVGPLGMHWEDTHVARIAEAVTHFHSQTSAFEVDPSLVAREDWAQTLDRAINATEANPLEHKAQWKRMHKRLGRALDGLVEQWRARPLEHWVHGDLHLANALCRCDAPDDPVILIDLAEVRPGHWVEDAVYLERQLWSRSHRLAMAPVKTMRAARRTRGLAISDADHVLADIRRLLMASTAPAFLRTEGQPKHLEACLEQATEAATRLQVP
jgi:hypothetical protein